MRTRPLLLAAVVLCCALAAAGCGGDDGADAGEPPGDTSSTTTAADGPAEEPAPDDESGDDEVAADTTTTEAIPSGPSATLTAITDRGVLRVGLPSGSAPFGGAAVDGFEPALARAVGEELVPGVSVELVERTAAGRFDRLAVGEYDLLLGLNDHTVQREADANWTAPYLLNGLVALVSTGGPIASAADLAEAEIVSSGAPEVVDALAGALDAAGLSGVATSTVGSPPEAVEAVRSDSAVAAAIPWAQAVLEVNRSPDTFSVVSLGVVAAPIAIATALADPAFVGEVDAALAAVIDDGTWLALFEEWVGSAPPWTAEEMAGVSPA